MVWTIPFPFSINTEEGRSRLVSTHHGITNMKHRHTITQLQEAVNKSISLRQLLQHLDMACRGGNYKTVKKRLAAHNIDTSHFTGQAHAAGKTLCPRRPTSDYLDNLITIDSNRLRIRLLKEEILQPTCSCCGLTLWMDGPIPLELDHIDGNSEDNSLHNLRLLCPNCHALTPTYRGKNKRCSVA